MDRYSSSIGIFAIELGMLEVYEFNSTHHNYSKYEPKRGERERVREERVS